MAAILGKVDALSLWDVYWEDLEYDAWYELLNCGIRLPASTGSDWFLCSANRVYTKTQPEFEYTSWMQALRDGKTFITNGPMLGINVDGSSVGDTVQASSGDRVAVDVDWKSHYPVHRVEVVANGRPVHTRDLPEGSTGGSFECEVDVAGDGWIARVSAVTRGTVSPSPYGPIPARLHRRRRGGVPGKKRLRRKDCQSDRRFDLLVA